MPASTPVVCFGILKQSSRDQPRRRPHQVGTVAFLKEDCRRLTPRQMLSGFRRKRETIAAIWVIPLCGAYGSAEYHLRILLLPLLVCLDEGTRGLGIKVNDDTVFLEVLQSNQRRITKEKNSRHLYMCVDVYACVCMRVCVCEHPKMKFSSHPQT